ncbi:acetate--CoA ligase [Legionella israelensis]|uniref:Acetate--CoA ligase n=1 Tax=Legionella israelensis TaxID=454 RepID=A0AAX1EK67_9GAMM|nr:acetate--CoA ligase [Legionella israelensis]QBR85242.1 acetate--CoA ligase [Legionella israelensis]
MNITKQEVAMNEIPADSIKLWNRIAKESVSWIRPWDTILKGDFEQDRIQWFCGGQLNVSVNCIDRHLPSKANQAAILWEGDEEHQQRTLTFAELHQEVSRMGNVLKKLGIGKGDKVGIYLPMLPEAAIAMLACARIGAVHSVVFAGFSAPALQQRLHDAECKILITADGYQRGGQSIALKQKADEATKNMDIQQLVVRNNNNPVQFDMKKHHWWHELKQEVSPDCPPEIMDAEDPFFILYTSGSTGKPKGLVHTTGGYLVQTAFSHQQVFDCGSHEIFWCTADVGWITGHSYVVYGPLCNGITSLMYAGVPNWPNPSRIWNIVDKHQVNVLYTAPTAIRALQRAGDEWLKTSSRQSLRLLGSVGEPINPEVWHWYHEQVGLKRCKIVDTWWQTETGAIMISPTANSEQLKAGSASQPLPGIEPVLLNEQGEEILGEGEGRLAIKSPWPSIARTIAGDHKRYLSTYFSKGYYITGDGAYRDADGDYWITGRIDDVLNVSGHRLGTAEIESALVSHPHVAEAAVVGIPHDIKGQAVHAFVELKRGCQPEEKLKEELTELVKKEIGAIAKPEVIQFATDLPKTRSGKIMRRILRKIASKEISELNDLGDLSTLANPDVVEELMSENKA